MIFLRTAAILTDSLYLSSVISMTSGHWTFQYRGFRYFGEHKTATNMLFTQCSVQSDKCWIMSEYIVRVLNLFGIFNFKLRNEELGLWKSRMLLYRNASMPLLA